MADRLHAYLVGAAVFGSIFLGIPLTLLYLLGDWQSALLWSVVFFAVFGFAREGNTR